MSKSLNILSVLTLIAITLLLTTTVNTQKATIIKLQAQINTTSQIQYTEYEDSLLEVSTDQCPPACLNTQFSSPYNLLNYTSPIES